MKPIQVLIVDDSAFIRKILQDILSSCEDMEVAGTCRNGQEALDFLEKQKVDVITLDIEMPVMDGMKTLQKIMQKKPLPVIMLSSLTAQGAKHTFAALEAGAVDFIEKPTNIFKLGSDQIQHDILQKIRAASKVKPHAAFPVLKTKTITRRPEKDCHREIQSIVAIGTSTGGPRALQSVLPGLSPDIQAPVVIVQHMPKGFTKSLAERLDSLCAVHVKEAEDGELLCKGVAYIAPGDQHMVIEPTGVCTYKIRLLQSERVGGHKPSVNVLFESLSVCPARIICTLMTGMGSDGTEGMRILKSKPKTVSIAEDASTCVVFGMPKSAQTAGVVDRVLPLPAIADAINQLTEGYNA